MQGVYFFMLLLFSSLPIISTCLSSTQQTDVPIFDFLLLQLVFVVSAYLSLLVASFPLSIQELFITTQYYLLIELLSQMFP